MAKRGAQRQPTKQAVANYLQMLKEAADGGDTIAAGWLVFISEKRKPGSTGAEGGKAHD